MYLSTIKIYFDHLQYAQNICHWTFISTQQSTINHNLIMNILFHNSTFETRCKLDNSQ